MVYAFLPLPTSSGIGRKGSRWRHAIAPHYGIGTNMRRYTQPYT